MPSNTITVGEHLFDWTIHVTKFVEYGVSVEALLAGQATPPPEGARIDGYAEGVIDGPKLRGTITAADYAKILPDGRIQLHFHAEITTEDGEKIALFGEGIDTPEEGTGNFQHRSNGTLTTSSAAYSWVNELQVWIQGTVDLAKRELNAKAYAA